MFEYTFEQLSQQSDAQPLAMIIWLRWLVLVNLIPPLFFLRHMPARWVLGAMIFITAVNLPLGMMFGFSKVLAIPHLIVWIPLVIYLAREWRDNKLHDTAIFKSWIMAVMITDLISVVFDIRDAVFFLRGDTGIHTADISDIPYATFAAVIVALAALFFYIRRKSY